MAKGKKKKQVQPPAKQINLQEDSQINQKMIDALEHLFTLTSPGRLRNSVNYVFYQFLFHAEDAIVNTDFKYLAEDIYLLQEFLGKASGNDDE